MPQSSSAGFTKAFKKSGSDTDEDVDRSPRKHRCCSVPHRYLVAFMMSLGILLIIGLRSSFALILTHVTTMNQSATANIIFSHCPVSNTSLDVTVDLRGDVKLMSHSALYTGLAVSVMVSGIICTFVSTKLVAGVAFMMSSVITFLYPVAIPHSTPLTFFLRVLEGVFGASVQSASFAIVSAWSTGADKAIMFSIMVVGFYVAPALSSVLTAVTVCFMRWDGIFYILGGANLLWLLVWFQFFYETPDLHPSLSSGERQYLRKYGGNVKKSSTEMLKNTPWRSILTSKGVWAVAVAVSVRLGIYTILILDQSQYFEDAFSIKIEDLGILLMVPYVLMMVTSILGGLISDKLIALGLSTTATRKIAFLSGYIGEGVCLAVLYFIDDWVAAFIILTTGAALEGFGNAGYSPLMSDMSPQYTGILYGMTTGIGVGGVGMFTTTFISLTAGKFQSLESWQNIYLVAALIHLVGCGLFFVLADASPQPWAEGRQCTVNNDNAHDTDEENSDSYEMLDGSATSLLAGHERREKSGLKKEHE